jgi:hypothetical protein
VGLKHLKAHPECAFVAGHSRWMTFDGSPLTIQQPPWTKSDCRLVLLHGDWIWLIAATMYRRAVFEVVGVFDTSLRACEDYDLYFRITRDFPINCHDEVVMEHRRHSVNTTGNHELMLKSTLTVLCSQWKYVRTNERYRRSYEAGVRFWQGMFGEPLIDELTSYAQEREYQRVMRGLLVLLRYYPRGLVSVLQRAAARSNDLLDQPREMKLRLRQLRDGGQAKRL